MKILTLIRFELMYRLKSPSTYIYWVLMLLLGMGLPFLSTKILQVSDLIHVNAPIVIDQTMCLSLLVFLFIMGFVSGFATIKDFEYDTEPLLFVQPITKREYVLGGFIGSLLILFLIYSGYLLGAMYADYSHMHSLASYAPFSVEPYLRSFFFLITPAIISISAFFHLGGSLSKHSRLVYLLMISSFVVLTVGDEVLEFYKDSDAFIHFDFFLIQSIQYVTNGWGVTEINHSLLELSGPILVNRLSMYLFSILFLIITVFFFKSSKLNIK